MNTTNDPATPGDDEQPLDPAEMVALMRSQAQVTGRADRRLLQWMLVGIGGAWFVGYALLWSSDLGGNPWFRIPGSGPAITFAILILLSSVSALVLGSLIGRGTVGPSARSGTMYGIAWPIVMTATGLFGAGLMRAGLSAELAGLFWPAAFIMAAGTLNLVGAAIWRSIPQYVLGALLVATPVVATIVGAPHHYLVYSLVAGGASVVFGVLLGRGRLDRSHAATGRG